MKTFRTCLLVVPALFMAGCSSFGSEQVGQLNTLIEQGRCAEAEAIAGDTSDPVRFSNLGVVAHNCEKNPVKARGYYEYGARLGDKAAISNLLRNNWPVPSADIKYSHDAQREAQATSGLMLLQAAQPKPAQMNRPQSCVTRFNNGVAYTDCN